MNSNSGDPSTCLQTVTWTPPTAINSCGGAANVSSTHNPGEAFPVGTTTVIYTFADCLGNSSSCSFTVTIVDNTKPVVTCPPDVAATGDANCVANLSIEAIGTATGLDNCGIATINGTRQGGLDLTDPYPLGDTYITWTATDVNGNVSQSCDQKITVSGTYIVNIACPADINTTATPGTCSKVIPVAELGTPTILQGCGVKGFYKSRDDNASLTAAYPVGTTIITWEALDENFETLASCEQTVTISDFELPAITGMPGDINISNTTGNCSGIATWTPPVPSDNCGIASFTSNYEPGAVFPVGETTVTYTATDIHNNENTASFTVTVNDTEAPVFGRTPNVRISNEEGTCSAAATWNTPTVTDNCGGAIDLVCDHTSGETFPVGTTAVTFTATDTHGNVGTASFNVIVQDNELPVITLCPSVEPFCKSGDDNYTIPALTATDNCGIKSIAYTITGPISRNKLVKNVSSLDASGQFGVGVSTILWEVIDAHNNSSTCTTTVTVNPLPVATISGTAQVCLNSTPPPVVFLAGGQGTEPYTFTYSINDGNSQQITSTGNSATIAQATDVAGTYTYKLIEVADANGCSQAIGETSVITVDQALTAPDPGPDQTICYLTAAQINAAPATGGSGIFTYQWQSSPDGLTDWADIDLATGLSFNTGSLMETAYYRLIATDPSCGPVTSNKVEIAVGLPGTQPSIGADQTICYNTSPASPYHNGSGYRRRWSL